MSEKINITSPVGRIVAGSLYKGNDKDFDGKRLVYKNGSNAGQPRLNYFFALAIPKNPGEQHWAHTEWGKIIWAVGCKEYPQASQRPDFSWKVEDGDSTIPGKGQNAKRPCDKEGYPGHWILKLSTSFAVTIYKQEAGGFVKLDAIDAVKPGYYVQVSFSVDGNGQDLNPGVYLNPNAVCFRLGLPEHEISFGPNVEEMGFGEAPLPAGVSTVPTAIASMPSAPVAPLSIPAPSLAPPIPVPSLAPPIPVTPNPQFLQMPAPSAAPGVIPPPPVPTMTTSPSKHQMTPVAAGVSYDAFVAAGWTDAQLIATGRMLA